MNDLNSYILTAIVIMASVTFLIRLLPFILFRDLSHTPKTVQYLGKFTPPAILAMLVIYSIKHISLTMHPYGLPELISIAVVIGLHLWKRQYLLSIIGGTGVYMIVLRLI